MYLKEDMMAYEEFTKKGGQAKHGVFVSITPQKTLILSHDCHERFFKGCNAIIFFYDPERKCIGLKPLKESEERSYSIRVTRKTSNIYVITANAFLHHYGIDYSERRKYEPTWNEAEGVVEIDLNKPL